MKPQTFKGLDGKIYRVSSPLEVLVDGETIRLPQISKQRSIIDIINHMIMIVAAEPAYLNAKDMNWQLAHLTDFRQFALKDDSRNPVYMYLNTLERLTNPLSRARAIFVCEMIHYHLVGLWLCGSHRSGLDRITPGSDSTYNSTFDIPRSLKSMFTRNYFNGAVYECHVPESAALVISAYTGSIRLEASTKFHVVQTRFHGSDTLDLEGYDVEVINQPQPPKNLHEFKIPGRFLIQNQRNGLNTTHEITSGIHPISVPSSWITGIVTCGGITTALPSFSIPENADLSAHEIIDLNAEPDFRRLIVSYDFKRNQSAAIARLLQHQSLGLTQSLVDYLPETTNYILLEKDVVFIDGIDWSKDRVPTTKVGLRVKDYPILFNLVPEVRRNLNWFFLRKRLTLTAFASMVLSPNNLNSRESSCLYGSCYCPDYFLEVIVNDKHRESIRQKIKQHL